MQQQQDLSFYSFYLSFYDNTLLTRTTATTPLQAQQQQQNLPIYSSFYLSIFLSFYFSFYHAIFLSILGLPSPTEDAITMMTTHLQEQQQQQDLPLYLSFYLSLLGLPITVGFLPSV
jgi:hypothetical protein